MIDQLIEYTETEKKLIDEEIELLKTLPREDLISKGLLISDCLVIRVLRNEVSVNCNENNSKLKAGDTVSLIFNNIQKSATVIENMIDEIDLFVSPDTKLKIGQVLDMKIERVNLLDPIISALKMIRPGMPGYFFYESVSGMKQPLKSMRGSLDETEIESILCNSSYSLDTSQKEIVASALRRPSMLAVQGPPGTGKTRVLAIIARELAEKGNRVAIMAPTHKAVNNCLQEISAISEDLSVYKIGEELKSEELKGGNVENVSFRKFKAIIKKKNARKNIIAGMTYYSAILYMGLRPDSFGPNVVLIDEAAQIPLAYGITAGMFGAGSVILFGDDAQMPPIFQEEFKDHILSKSLFSQIRHAQPEVVRHLTVTYRLNEYICRIVGTLYYKDSLVKTFLQPSPLSSSRKLKIESSKMKNGWTKEVLDPDHSMIFVQSENEELCKDTNEKEAKAVAEIISQLLSCGLSVKDLAVITPFRKQSILIKGELKKLEPKLKDFPIIDTVEKVQGTSVEVVIVSYATNDADYISQLSDFLFSPNRLNVSISRARTKVIIFASNKCIDLEYPSTNRSQFRYLLDHSVLVKADN